jgi:flagellar biosynthesis/type III secretory pathway chaperone
MHALLNDLLDLLTRQVTLYDAILAILAQECEALVSRCPQVVLDLARQKETLILKIRTLEESRLLVCQRLAKIWGMPASALTLAEIAAHSDAETGAKLLQIRSRMRECMDALHRANEQSASLCRQGMETVRTIVEAVAGEISRPGRQAYGPKAYGPKAGTASRSSEPASTKHWST